MNRKDLLHTIFVYMAIIILCITFFVIGYGQATKKTVEVANNIMIKLVEENKICIDEYSNIAVYEDIFMFNMSTMNLTKIEETT